MARSGDEPDSEYGLIAESVVIAEDRSWVQYNLRAAARFHDGSPITPADVIWTFDTLKSKGDPHYQLYYADVLKAEPAGERGVRFSFRSGDNRELPSIVGQLPVLSKNFWAGRDFAKTTLEPPLGSGPYKVDTVDAGRAITYRRVEDYWAKDLPVNRGRYNFDVMRYDYYRDSSIALEAFKAGEYDLRVENVAKNWAIGYDSPALKEGLIKKEEVPNKVPQGMQAFGCNLRRPLFQDARVRQALGYLFDFEWTNKVLFYGAYTRTKSYFSNSELASSGLPSAEERAILEKFKGEIPDAVFTEVYEPPKTDGSGNIRENLRSALELLQAAGWTVKGGRLVDAKGDPFAFEFLLAQPEFERIILPFAQNLEASRRERRRAHHRSGAIREPHAELRLRHGDRAVSGIAVARQRAAGILELGRRRRAGQQQSSRHQEQGCRCPRGSHHQRARSGEPRHARSCARPRAAAQLLRHSQLAPDLFPRRRLE